MNTMKWLLRREFWEHKGSIFWAPVVAAVLLFCLVNGTVMYGAAQGALKSEIAIKLAPNGQQATTIHTGFDSLPNEAKANMAQMAANGYVAFAAPLFAMLTFVSFFYCLGALHDERRDRSILFWKSLPVSDTQTVLSKALIAGFVAPLITVVVGLILSILTLLVVGSVAAFEGINLMGTVLSASDFYLTPLRMLGMLPVYLVWALPTIGWLLLVSSWAKSKVFLWAVGAPLLAVGAIKWATYLLGFGLNMDWVIENILARGLGGLAAGNWLPLAHIDKADLANAAGGSVMSSVFTASWMTLGTPQALIGAAVGAAMIYGAIRIRRWKDEG